MLKIEQIGSKIYRVTDHDGRVVIFTANHTLDWRPGSNMIRMIGVHILENFSSSFDDMEINGVIPASVEDAFIELEKFVLPFNDGGGDGGGSQGDIDGAIATHNLSSISHSDIRSLISNLQAALLFHNTDSAAHADIRQLITDLEEAIPTEIIEDVPEPGFFASDKVIVSSIKDSFGRRDRKSVV